MEAVQAGAEPVAVEDVVAQDQPDPVVADVVGADDERLGQPVRARLHGVRQRDPELRPVTQEPVELLDPVGRGDDQPVLDPGQHQRGERVVDHRLVVDRHQLLAHREGDGVQPGAGPAGQDDSTHGSPP